MTSLYLLYVFQIMNHSETVSQHAMYWDAETEAAKLKSAILSYFYLYMPFSWCQICYDVFVFMFGMYVTHLSPLAKSVVVVGWEGFDVKYVHVVHLH